MIKVIVLGAVGRMGSTILKLVDEDPELMLYGAIEKKILHLLVNLQKDLVVRKELKLPVL